MDFPQFHVSTAFAFCSKPASFLLKIMIEFSSPSARNSKKNIANALHIRFKLFSTGILFRHRIHRL